MPDRKPAPRPRLDQFMALALEEAACSLREGNSGFGAVLVRNDTVLARAHDIDTSSGDPTAHAEMQAIRLAAARIGRDLSDCLLVSTHEPCPMCSTAALWAGIREIAYGCSIAEALGQGRRRVDLSVGELYRRAGKELTLHEDVLHDACALLYHDGVRKELAVLRGAGVAELRRLAEERAVNRLHWLRENELVLESADPAAILDAAYRLFLDKLGIPAGEAPVVRREEHRLVIHSRNFCPTLEACKLLGLDTATVCRELTERPMAELLRGLHPGLRFSRNYASLRPRSGFCEEMIAFEP